MMDQHRTDAVEVTCMVDGSYVFEDADFPEIMPDIRDARLAKAGLATVTTDFNAYVLRHADGIDLLDTGCGTQFGPGAGLLPDALAQMGIAPGMVRRIILTHLHTDHAGGLLLDGQVAYPNGRLVLHRDELSYWQGKGGFRDQALTAYAGRIDLVTDGDDLGHGMRVWALPGHTPGHFGLRVGVDLALVGDVIHSEALQFCDLDTHNANDVDRVAAETSRRACLDQIVAERLVWSGSHILGPGKFARLTRSGDGYLRTPQ